MIFERWIVFGITKAIFLIPEMMIKLKLFSYQSVFYFYSQVVIAIHMKCKTTGLLFKVEVVLSLKPFFDIFDNA